MVKCSGKSWRRCKSVKGIGEIPKHITGVCLKNAFCKMYIPICGKFRLNEGGVTGYVN